MKNKPEIRKDYFLNRYVIITPNRRQRPRNGKAKNESKPCGFCPTGIEKNLIIKAYGPQKPWSAMVLKNKYPIVSLDNPGAYGEHRVIIETPDHRKKFSQLSLEEIINLIKVFQDQIKIISKIRTCPSTLQLVQGRPELIEWATGSGQNLVSGKAIVSKEPGSRAIGRWARPIREEDYIPKIKNIEYILLFKNEGQEAGASLAHSHSQIFASQLLPPAVEKELLTARQYQIDNGICPYCQILKTEEKSPRRIYSDRFMVTFAPCASAFHYEAWIFPRRHVDNLADIKQGEIESLAKVLKKISTKINRLNLSYNFFLDQVIKDRDQHFYLKIQPRGSTWGGIELGSGLIVNSITPEEAARYYRK